MRGENYISSLKVMLELGTNANYPVALNIRLQFVSSLVDEGIILGAVVLAAMYLLIVLEVNSRHYCTKSQYAQDIARTQVAHRAVVTMLAATVAVGVLALLDERPSLEEIITWIDVETLTLLFR